MNDKSTKSWIALLFSLALGVLAYQAAFAQTPLPSDDEVNAIAKQLYCPVCENTPLDVCPTQVCAQWRELIREQLADGWSEAQIKQYFVDRYGARVLATPPPTGLNWLVYIIPPVAIALGVLILFRSFSSWKKPVNEIKVEPAEATNSDEYMRRIEEELRKQ